MAKWKKAPITTPQPRPDKPNFGYKKIIPNIIPIL